MPFTRGHFCGCLNALLAVVILPFLSTAPVFAEWVLIDGNEHAKIYVEAETIQRKGDVVTLWVLDDFKTVRLRGLRTYLSSRALEAHDCANERFRILSLADFSSNMAVGDIIFRSARESDWAAIPRGTLAQSVWTFACAGKRK
jgi:hypothetical protein